MKDRMPFKDHSTMDENIRAGKKLTVTHFNTSTLFKIDDEIIAEDDNIIYQYLDELNSYKYEYRLTDDEKVRYKMRPDLFCYDKYGDYNLDFIILALNDMISDKDFTRSTVYMISPDYMTNIITEIINAEENYMLFNRRNYETSGAF